MTEVPFHTTRMGVRFYESTLPELVRQVSRLAEALERIADIQSRQETAHEPEGRRDQDPQPPQS